MSPPRLAVAGRPRVLTSPSDIPVIERLAASGNLGVRWVTVLEPIPTDRIADRYARLSALSSSLAEEANRTIRRTELETLTFTDPTAERLGALVAEDTRHAERALLEGGFVAVSYLVERDGDARDARGSLAAAAGVIGEQGRSRATPSPLDGADRAGLPDTHARPLRILPSDGRYPASFLSSSEIASLIQPPLHDTAGLPCRRWARFDARPEALHSGGAMITIGHTPDGRVVHLPADQLVTHALVAGVTGAGKSTLLHAILGQAGVPFLVIEPTKDEYRHFAIPNLAVWRVGAPGAALTWQLNPLEVPAGTPISTHIGHLNQLFRASLGLFAPLGFVVEMALQRSYEERGWDLASGTNPNIGIDDALVWPTLTELVDHGGRVIDDLGYRGEIAANLSAALRARLGMLTTGPLGRTFDTEATFDAARLLGQPTVVNLDLVADDDAKAFVIGLLLIRVSEARRGQHSRSLRHLLVLEEAHRILGNGAGSQSNSAETGTVDPAGHATELFAGLAAEARSAGQGLIFVDQRPSLLSGAVANTGTKLGLRTVDTDDRDMLARCMSMTEAQADHLTALPVHRGALFWESMDRPVLVDLVAQYFDADVSPAPADPRPPYRLPTDPVLKRAIDRLVRTAPQRSGPVREEVRRLVGRRLPPSAQESGVAGVERRLVEDAVDALGRVRRWPPATRAAATDAVMASRDVPEHPSRLLVDGRQLCLACEAVCPSGGCIAGELTEARVRVLRSDPAVSLGTILQDPERARRRLRRETQGLLGRGPAVAADDSDELDIRVSACLVARALDEVTTSETVASVLEELHLGTPDTGTTR